MSKVLIVGIDPGTTTAVVSIDINGRLVDVESRRSFSTDDVVSHINDIGLPVIVATDRVISPKKVEKVATAFPAKLFHPETRMSRKEKAEATKDVDFDFNNQHEKDAAAAALFAYKSYRHTLKKVERRLQKEGLDRLREDISREVILKKKNIGAALKEAAHD